MNNRWVLNAAITGVCLSIAVSSSAFATVVTKGQEVQLSDLTNPDPLPPTDIYRPSGATAPKHQDLATFAWLEFIALTAPVQLESRGVSALTCAPAANRGMPGGSFADSGFDQSVTLVWETYQHRVELFPYTDGTAVPPQPWNNQPLYQFYIGPTNDKTPYETPEDVSCYGNLDEATQIGQNAIFFPDLTVGRGSDSKGTTESGLDQILFEAKVNQVQSDFVRQRVESNDTSPIDLDDNTIEVKAAWLPLTAIPEDQQYRYHISEVTVYEGEDGAPNATTEMRALVGLHIIQKTPNFPSFIFATFEHVDLLQDPDTQEPTNVAYIPTYDEIAYLTPTETTLNGIPMQPTVTNPDINFDVNNPVARPNRSVVDLPLGSVEDLPNAMDIGDGQVLVPVVQPPTTNSQVDAVNDAVHGEMNGIPGFDETFVWQYYKLKGVQGVPVNTETSEDFYLANIVIESSQPGIQLFRGGTKTTTDNNVVTFNNVRSQTNVVDAAQNAATFSQGGCQGCHGVAQTQVGSDFSFLFGGDDGKGFTPDTVGVKSQDVMLTRLARYSLLLDVEPPAKTSGDQDPPPGNSGSKGKGKDVKPPPPKKKRKGN